MGSNGLWTWNSKSNEVTIYMTLNFPEIRIELTLKLWGYASKKVGTESQRRAFLVWKQYFHDAVDKLRRQRITYCTHRNVGHSMLASKFSMKRNESILQDMSLECWVHLESSHKKTSAFKWPNCPHSRCFHFKSGGSYWLIGVVNSNFKVYHVQNYNSNNICKKSCHASLQVLELQSLVRSHHLLVFIALITHCTTKSCFNL